MTRRHAEPGVSWYAPGGRRPVATSTLATNHLLEALADDGLTFAEADDVLVYDTEAIAVVAEYLRRGYWHIRMRALGVGSAEGLHDGAFIRQ